MVGCTIINPYTGQQQVGRAVKYGAISSVVCGVIGAGVGAYMDGQEAELRQELQGRGVQVARNGDQLDLIMPGNVTSGRGVEQSRILSQGMGLHQPLASNADEAGRSQNRRVELQIVAAP